MNRDEVLEEIEGWLEYSEEDDNFSISDSGDAITVSINIEV